jgi:uncharacterized protein YndB with AHSA1/START domain
MADITNEFIVATTAQRVWAALTRPEEIARWWTDDLNVTPEVGTVAELRFRPRDQGTFVIQFEIAGLDQDEKVYWITRSGPPTGHWKGTSVTWQLETTHNGTRVIFKHEGFTQADERFEITRAWWEHFVVSLKSYLETGKGSPGSPFTTIGPELQKLS